MRVWGAVEEVGDVISWNLMQYFPKTTDLSSKYFSVPPLSLHHPRDGEGTKVSSPLSRITCTVFQLISLHFSCPLQSILHLSFQIKSLMCFSPAWNSSKAPNYLQDSHLPNTEYKGNSSLHGLLMLYSPGTPNYLQVSVNTLLFLISVSLLLLSTLPWNVCPLEAVWPWDITYFSEP